MSRHSLLITLVLVTFVAQPAAAQTAAGPPGREALTLRSALAEALARNPELEALRREHEAARAVPAQERHLAAPMLEAQIWAWPVTTLNPARTDMYMLTAEQELPGRGKRAARVLVAERGADMAREQIAVGANQILGELKQAYVDLALARETVLLYERQTPVLEDMAEAATLRYAAGQGAQHHTVTSLVELTRLQKDRIRAAEHVQAAEARLSTLLGRPMAQPVEPLAPTAAAIPVADAEQRALSRHPELSLAAAEIAREVAELDRLRGERRPDFVVGGGYMLMPGDAGAWTARAGLTWPNAPWSRGRLTAALDVQAKRLESVKARREAIASRIRQRVREAVVRLAAAERQVQLIESTVLPQIEHAFELTRVAYAGGEGAFADVLESRRLLLATQLEHVEARADVVRAGADVESAVGAYE